MTVDLRTSPRACTRRSSSSSSRTGSSMLRRSTCTSIGASSHATCSRAAVTASDAARAPITSNTCRGTLPNAWVSAPGYLAGQRSCAQRMCDASDHDRLQHSSLGDLAQMDRRPFARLAIGSLPLLLLASSRSCFGSSQLAEHRHARVGHSCANTRPGSLLVSLASRGSPLPLVSHLPKTSARAVECTRSPMPPGGPQRQ